MSENTASYPPKNKTVRVLQIITVVSGVWIILFLFLQLGTKNRTIAQLQSQLDVATNHGHSIDWYAQNGGLIPVRATYRRALLGSGYVLVLYNYSSEVLSVVVNLQNPTFDREKTYNLVLQPGPKAAAQIGHFEGWILAPGDLVQISHAGFDPLNFRIR